MKVNFSKNGNLIYEGYVSLYEDMWCLQMADCSFAAEMPTKQGLIDEAFSILEWYILRNIEHDHGVFLPKTKLKPKKGYEIIEFELDKELSDMVMDFVEAGGKVFNA